MLKVYTPAEVAEILRVSEQDVYTLIRSGEMEAFSVLGHPRITEQAIEKLMSRPYHRDRARPRPKTGARRNRNPGLENDYRQQVLERLRRVAPDMRLIGGRANFTANGKQVLVRIATTPGTTGRYWFGFSAQLIREEPATFLVLGLADRGEDLVIPCKRFQAVIDGLSVDRSGHKKVNVQLRSGSYYLTGKGIEQPLPVDSYVNAFELLR